MRHTPSTGEAWPSGRTQKKKRNRRVHLRILAARIVKRAERAKKKLEQQKRREERAAQYRKAA